MATTEIQVTAVSPTPSDLIANKGGVSLADTVGKEETTAPARAKNDDTSEDTNDSKVDTSNNGSDEKTNNVKMTAPSETLKPVYMTGLPVYITFGSLMPGLNWRCAMMPLTGKIFAIFPLRYTFIAFIFIFEIGNLISGVAVSLPMLIIGRAITGIGGPGLVTVATSILTTIRPLEKRHMLIGTTMGSVAIGQVAGPLVGGALSQLYTPLARLKRLQTLAQGTAITSDDNNAIVSRVMLLPTIVSQLVAPLLCGFLVQRTGYYLPEGIGGNSLVAIASGLCTTFTQSTNTGEWIGYHILGGAGRGFVMQLLTTVIQANVPFINTGVTDLRSVIPASEINGVIVYNSALVNVYYLQLALSATALVCSCFRGWRNIHKPHADQTEKADAEVGATEKKVETKERCKAKVAMSESNNKY